MRPRLACFVALVALLTVAPAANAATALTAQTTVAKVGRQRVGYRSIGSGRPLVLVMGLAGTIDGWDPTFLDALAAGGHRVVVFDNEGVGKTTALRGPLSIARMADTTAGLISALHLKRPDVGGWSMGGMIAQSLALRHPKSLRKLVLMATAPGDGHASAPLPDALQLLLHPNGDPLALLGLLFPADQTAARDAYVSHIAQYKPFEGLAPAAQIAKQTSASSLWITGQDPDGKREAKLRLPTLVGGGEDDHLLPVANQQHIAETITGARLVTYPDSAHGFFIQNEDDWTAKMLAFLK